MPPSGIVQFREPLDLLAALHRAGVSPNELGRQAFEKEARRVLAREKERALAAAAVRLPKRATALVREGRDEH